MDCAPRRVPVVRWGPIAKLPVSLQTVLDVGNSWPADSAISLFDVVVTVAVGAVSAILMWLAIQSDWRIAEKSGSFEEADLVAYIARRELKLDGRPRKLLYGRVVWPESTKVVAYIPVAVKNQGGKTATGVTVTYRFPSGAQFAVEEPYGSYRLGGAVVRDSTGREYSRSGSIENVSYPLPDINPGQVFTLKEEVYIPETDSSRVVGVPQRLRRSVGEDLFAVRSVISVSSNNMAVKDYPIEIISASVDGYSGFKSTVLRVLGNEGRSLKDTLSVVDKIGYIFSDLPKVSAVSFYARPDVYCGYCGGVQVDTTSYDEFYWSGIYLNIWFRYPNKKSMSERSKPEVEGDPALGF